MGARTWLFLAGVLGATGVALGAYQAHALEKLLLSWEIGPDEVQRRLDICETAIRIQMFHALALIGVAIVASIQPLARIWGLAGLGFFLGILLFCGALYESCFWGTTRFLQLAPWGGGILIASWSLIALGSFWYRFADDDEYW